MNVTEIDIPRLSGMLRDVTNSRYTSAAGMTIVIYDILITLGDEVRLVWPSRCSLPKVLFYINRYLPPIFLILSSHQLTDFGAPLSDRFCRVFIPLDAFSQVITTLCASWLLMMRVLATYRNSIPLTYFLYSLMTASYLACTGLVIWASTYMVEFMTYNTIIRACMTPTVPQVFKFFWIPPIIFETVLGVLTVYQTVTHLTILRHRQLGPIMHVVLRDGTVSFITIILIYMSSCLVWTILPVQKMWLVLFLQAGVVSTLVSRLYLNLRSATAGDHAFSNGTFVAGRHQDAKHIELPIKRNYSISDP